MKHLLKSTAIFLSALLLLGFAEGKAFDKWTTTSEGVTFASETSAENTFKMPAKDVAVTATYCHNHAGKLVISFRSDCVAHLDFLEIHGGETSITSTAGQGIYNSSINVYGGKLTVISENDTNYSAINIMTKDFNIYGGKLFASCPNGENVNAISGYVKSGTSKIKFYSTDTEDQWGTGEVFSSNSVIHYKYVKAE